jgi:hypothetical protein
MKKCESFPQSCRILQFFHRDKLIHFVPSGLFHAWMASAVIHPFLLHNHCTKELAIVSKHNVELIVQMVDNCMIEIRCDPKEDPERRISLIDSIFYEFERVCRNWNQLSVILNVPCNLCLGKGATFDVNMLRKQVNAKQTQFPCSKCGKQCNMHDLLRDDLISAELRHLIDPQHLILGDEIGKGNFGVVRKGTWKGIDVCIKTLTTSNDEKFLSEIRLHQY